MARNSFDRQHELLEASRALLAALEHVTTGAMDWDDKAQRLKAAVAECEANQ